MLKPFKRLLLGAMAILCLCGAAFAQDSGDAAASALPPEYHLAAENSRLALYLREDIMAIIVESKEHGQRLYSAVQNPQDMKDPGGSAEHGA